MKNLALFALLRLFYDTNAWLPDTDLQQTTITNPALSALQLAKTLMTFPAYSLIVLQLVIAGTLHVVNVQTSFIPSPTALLTKAVMLCALDRTMLAMMNQSQPIVARRPFSMQMSVSRVVLLAR